MVERLKMTRKEMGAHVARMEQAMNAYTILVGNTEG
jgi:hypothetical protein